MRVSRFRKCDFVKSRITNVSEFTNSRTNISIFTNSRAIFLLFMNHERYRFYGFMNHCFHFHEFTNKKANFRLHKRRGGPLHKHYQCFELRSDIQRRQRRRICRIICRPFWRRHSKSVSPLAGILSVKKEIISFKIRRPRIFLKQNPNFRRDKTIYPNQGRQGSTSNLRY